MITPENEFAAHEFEARCRLLGSDDYGGDGDYIAYVYGNTRAESGGRLGFDNGDGASGLIAFVRG